MILVTGATGLVGLHLLRQLSLQETPVKAMYRSEIPNFLEGTNSERIFWVQGDVLDVASLDIVFEEVQFVYHCAAMVSYDSRLAETMMQINVEGTANVVNFCLSEGVRKLVHVSSIASIGKAGNGMLNSEIDEFDEAEMNSNYAKSKFAGEMEVWRGIAEGLCAVILNPAIILGEGDWSRSSSNLFAIVHKEFPFYTKGITAWVDVKDLVNVMLKLMLSDIEAERFIVSSGNFAYRYIFTMMAKAMHKKPPHIEAKPWMTEVVWRLAYLKSVITGKVATITKETARSAQEVNEFSNEKILKALPGFSYTSIEETIERVCG